MKQLWTVEIETSVVVWAEDRKEAEQIAEHEFRQDFCDYYARPALSSGLPPAWDTSRPYGSEDDDDRTCLQILAEERERAAAEAEKRAAFEAHPKLEIEV